MGYEVDFLPVGDESKSGDAIVLRLGNLRGRRDEQFVAVVDGGFESNGQMVVDHVQDIYGTNWVDLVVSTHPDADHAGGLEVVLEKLDPARLWMHRPWNHTDDISRMFRDGRVTDESVRRALRRSLDNARALETIANTHGIPIEEPFRGRYVDGGGGRILVLGPSETFYQNLLSEFRGTPEPTALAAAIQRALETTGDVVSRVLERWDLETLDDGGKTSAENNSSAVLLVQSDDRNILLTGDAGIPALVDVADYLEEHSFDFDTLKFIQVPHHGSKRNVGPTILDRLVGPKLAGNEFRRAAYVSVAKKGEPKHPSKKVTNAFRRRGAYVYATQGVAIGATHEAPFREGWGPAEALEFFSEVEE